MVSIPLEGLWMVSDRIVDLQFFVKFHKSRHAIIFSFWTITQHVSYQLLRKPRLIRTSSRWWVLLWKVYEWFLIDFRYFVKFHRSRPAIIFSLWTITEQVSYQLPMKPRFFRNSSRWWVLHWKDYGWFLIDFRFLIKFHRFGPSIFFNYHRTC